MHQMTCLSPINIRSYLPLSSPLFSLVSCQAQARTMNLWTSSFADIKSLLTGGSQAMSNWVAEAKSLTQDWAMGFENGGHEWDGAAFTDSFVFAFQERMEEVYRIRETHEELSRLMRPDEAQSLGVTDVFKPFSKVNALQVSDFTSASWKGAKEEYQKRMGPIEQSISQRLRTLFTSTIVPAMVAAVNPQSSGGAVTQPLQIFQELKKYSGLMGMPIIASTLVAEKDALAKQVNNCHLPPVMSCHVMSPSDPAPSAVMSCH
jgi:dynein heavy chain 2